MANNLTLPQVKAYLSALWQLARHGNTFANEANEMIREIAHRDIILGEFFGHIEIDPRSPFESLLKQTAKELAK